MAPAMARSLIVPQTASLPMSPPGKNRGLTTKRVGGQGDALGADGDDRAVVRSGRGRGCEKRAGRPTLDQIVRVSRPPPPWASWIVSDANGRGHAEPAKRGQVGEGPALVVVAHEATGRVRR